MQGVCIEICPTEVIFQELVDVLDWWAGCLQTASFVQPVG